MMMAGNILRVFNESGGCDFFYLVNEIHIGNSHEESIVFLQSLSRERSYHDRAGFFHQVPTQIMDLAFASGSLELYKRCEKCPGCNEDIIHGAGHSCNFDTKESPE